MQITNSIKQIMNFIEKGGKLDIECIENELIATKKSEIIELFSRIIELENSIKSKNEELI